MSWRRQRERLFAEARGGRARPDPRRRRERRERRRRLALGAAVAAALGIALALASLRIEIFRQRYALAEALTVEKQLLERRRELGVEVARLRDPRRLRRLAGERGFARPERVIHLDAAAPTAGPRP